MPSASDVPCYALWGLVGVLLWASTLTAVLVALWLLPARVHAWLERALPAADLDDIERTDR